MMYHSYYTCDLCGKRVDYKGDPSELRRLYGWRSLCVYYHPDLNKDRGKLVQFDICPECDVLMLTLPHVEQVSEYKFDVTGEPTIGKVDGGIDSEGTVVRCVGCGREIIAEMLPLDLSGRRLCCPQCGAVQECIPSKRRGERCRWTATMRASAAGAPGRMGP